MNDQLKWRLTFFGLAISIVAILIAWTGYRTWREAEALNDQLGRVQPDSFTLASEFQASLASLHINLVSYRWSRNSGDWEKFGRSQADLDKWIDEQKNKLGTTGTIAEKSVLKRIDSAYDDYFLTAKRLHAEIERGARDSELATSGAATEKEFATLGKLDRDLLLAHQEALGIFQLSTRASANLLLKLLFGALLALLALVCWLAVVVYREMIHPLRVQLIESKALLERHEKLASLGILAAGVAHEIRNPLTAIKARLFTQQKALTPGSPAAKDAEIISSEINRLERIVRDFLTFARPSEPKLASISVRRLLAEIQDLLAGEMARSGIQLQLQPGEDYFVVADHAQIKQVLINLIQNAAESIDRSGSVTLGAKPATGRLGPGARRMVALEVVDTGKGIPPEVQPRLFDPFFTTKESGTGLGLSIAARIVEKHGGSVEFQTSPGRGTAFGVLLPQAFPA